MVRSLLLVWLIGVVAFFALWALLAMVVRRISEKRNGAALNEVKQVKTNNEEQTTDPSES